MYFITDDQEQATATRNISNASEKMIEESRRILLQAWIGRQTCRRSVEQGAEVINEGWEKLRCADAPSWSRNQ